MVTSDLIQGMEGKQMENIKAAIIHPAIIHSSFEENCKTLFSMNMEAARNGANIIVNTETALSGYSFESMEEILNFTVSENSGIIGYFGDIAEKYQCYICIGVAYKSPKSGIIYNSAIVFDASGELILRYSKINAEYKWACNGSPLQNNTFETPWGKVGVLICSDSYFSLLPRSAALRGAGLILIPANWPLISLDPCEIWKARAIENEVYVIAANRTGIDKTMDMRGAYSCVFDNKGNCILKKCSDVSSIFYADIPLEGEKIKCGNSRLKARQPEAYRSIYLDHKNVDDIETHCSLPSSGDIKVMAYSFIPGPKEAQELASSLAGDDLHTLLVFPESVYDAGLMSLLSEKGKCAVCYRSLQPDRDKWFFIESGEMRQVSEVDPVIQYGPARIALLRNDEIFHPERFLHFSKEGCDICTVSGGKDSDDVRLLAGVRTIEKSAVAASFDGFSSISLPPLGHDRWVQALADNHGCAELLFNTSGTRDKRLRQYYDYELLLHR